jgi:hypothetical protein
VLLAGAFVFLTAWLAASAAPPDSPLQKPDAPQPFAIGLLRRDGVVTPLGTFDGKDWTSPWPSALGSISVPISLDAVPAKWWGKAGALEEMTLWAGGERRGIVRLERPVAVAIMCSKRLGLHSNYVSSFPVPPPTERSYPKEGVVVSGDTPVEPVTPVPRSSPEWQENALLLDKPFDRAEKNATELFTEWKHPIKRAERRQVPLELDALYKAPMDAPGWVAYRFQAVKRYAPLPADGGCGLISSASGWIAVGPGGKHWTQFLVRITYCDRMDDVLTVPFGIVRAANRVYWIYQLSGYDREGYVVARPTPKTVETAVQYEAGVCPR